MTACAIIPRASGGHLPVHLHAMRLAIVVALAACSSAPKDPVDTLQDPATCMECHQQHYQEWSSSMHAYASTDPVFVAMNKRGQRDTNNELGTFCVQCHAPMQVALKLTNGADYDPTTLTPATNGITCYFCHDVKSVGATHNNGLVLALDQTMRGGVSNPVETPAHNSKYDPTYMASESNMSTMCGSCHDVLTPVPPSPMAVNLERTYSEWQTTIFATTPPPTGLTCSGCHMGTNVEPPTTVIADKPGLNVLSRPNSFHEHLWLGIDQALTPFPGTAAMPPPAPALTQAEAIKRDLDPALTIVGATPLTDTDGQIGSGYIEGGICVTHEQTITVRIDTRGTGHMWPSGASQDRRAWLQLIAYDVNNNILFQTGVVPDGMDPEDINDPNLVGFWDRIYKADGTPAHFFWEVNNEVTTEPGGSGSAALMGSGGQLVRPPTTLVQSSPAFDHSTTATFNVGGTIATAVDHIAAQILIRPYNFAMLNDLVSSGDLDASYLTMIPTLTIAGTIRTWTKSTVDDQFTDGCDWNPYQ
jgi:nitrate/TMAO reductase-like tetraheme cytochrome c subunit